MKETKNELLQFVGGIVMLAVGLFIFSQKVIVHSSWFGYGGFSVAGIRISSGLVIVPLIIGIIWMFATSSFASKVFTAISVILILAAVILNTDIRLVTMSLYEWVLILVLIFGEITPKNTANMYATNMAMAYAPIIWVLMIVLTPVIFIVDHLAGFFLWLLRIDNNKKKDIFTEDEIRTIVNVSQQEGVIESNEKKIINNLFDFGDSTAKDVMIPRIDMTLADVSSSYDDIISLFRQTMYTRIPIYENTPDNVIGILNIKDLIVNPSDNDTFNIRNIIRKPFFTFEQKNTSDLFKEMQLSSTSIAIVLSEYGTTSGMITTEDLLEEIVGEIRDEYDTDEKEALSKINDTTYRVDGSFKLDDLNDELGTKLESEDNDSVGGLIVERLDRLPKAGDKITIGNVWMFVEKVASNRAESVIVKIIPDKKDETKKAN